MQYLQYQIKRDWRYHKYVKGKDYHRVYAEYFRNKKEDKEYFQDWNAGYIDGRDVDEKKIFTYGDKYYITKMKNA